MIKADGIKTQVDGTTMATGMELANLIRSIKADYTAKGLDEKTADDMLRMATEMGIR